MSGMTGRPPVWWGERVGIDGMTLHAEDRTAVIPESLAAVLLGAQGPGVSAEPDHDLLRLEALLRGWVLDAGTTVRRCSRALTAAARRERELDGRWWHGDWWQARRAREDCQELLAEAFAWHHCGATYLKQLRHLVIGLAPQEGLLAEAAAGWNRPSRVPAGVSVYADEDTFLTDLRRGDPRMPALVIGGTELGQMWRRDPDDPVDQPLERPGCWTVGHIARTGEIYAVRRSHRDTRVVWLLGRGFSGSRARAVLEPLLDRQPEPNSLLLVADAVAAAQHTRQARAAAPGADAEESADEADDDSEIGPGP